MEYTKYSDIQLLDLVNKDYSSAFTELYNRYWDRLLIVAINKLNDYYLAEEIVQEIFLAIWRRRKEPFKTNNVRHIWRRL